MRSTSAARSVDVTSPGLPVPIVRCSTRTTGSTCQLELVRNTSSAESTASISTRSRRMAIPLSSASEMTAARVMPGSTGLRIGESLGSSPRATGVTSAPSFTRKTFETQPQESARVTSNQSASCMPADAARCSAWSRGQYQSVLWPANGSATLSCASAMRTPIPCSKSAGGYGVGGCTWMRMVGSCRTSVAPRASRFMSPPVSVTRTRACCSEFAASVASQASTSASGRSVSASPSSFALERIRSMCSSPRKMRPCRAAIVSKRPTPCWNPASNAETVASVMGTNVPLSQAWSMARSVARQRPGIAGAADVAGDACTRNASIDAANRPSEPPFQ